MSTIGNSFLGLIDLYKRSNGNGQITPVIEALNTLNPVMQDAVAVQANKGTRHLTTIRTGLGSVAWGRLYQGIPQSKSTTQQVEDTTGFMERLSSVDTRLLDLSEDPAALRMSEANPALEAMAQEMQTGFFYHDTATTPEKFKGLASRYGSLGGGGTGNQIVDAGGCGSDNTSIWIVTWGENQTSLIYPKGTLAGVQREDKGEQRVLDDLGNPYFVKEELFRQHVGVTVRDWRFNARVANIDVSDMLAGNVDLYKFMRQAFYKLQGRRNGRIGNGGMVSAGRTVLYMNRDVMQVLDALATNKGVTDNFIRLRPDEVQGGEVWTYRGFPIRETDALINAEARVV
jgi:hypothetical protein